MPDQPEVTRPPTAPERRPLLVRLLSAVGVVGMASPLIWVVVLVVLWLVARDALTGGLVFYVFGSTLLAMVVGVLLFAWADHLDQRRLREVRDDDGISPA